MAALYEVIDDPEVPNIYLGMTGYVVDVATTGIPDAECCIMRCTVLEYAPHGQTMRWIPNEQRYVSRLYPSAPTGGYDLMLLLP